MAISDLDYRFSARKPKVAEMRPELLPKRATSDELKGEEGTVAQPHYKAF